MAAAAVFGALHLCFAEAYCSHPLMRVRACLCPVAASCRLSGKRLVALDVASVVAGSTYRGEFEERLQSLLHDCETAQGSVVLFIDEIHVLGE
jgi:hypothetical protein